jgi:MoxR-like ATPase
VTLGVSPRGSQALYRAVQASAMLEGRSYALPDDVKRLAASVLGHRIIVASKNQLNARTTLAGSAGERAIAQILTEVEVPL